ncbi:MAG: ATP-binding protein [Bacteroidales bacterium]|nr:ATP-binding protein [Bacteroidales bacterium]
MASRKQKEPDNPFIYKGYEGPDYFCDRERETENMVGALRNGRNLTVFSPRKIGKTGLIKHVFNRIKETNKNAICIYIDIFATQNLYDFVQALGVAIVEEAVEREKSLMDKAFDTFKAWRPILSYDSLTGSPTISISIEPSREEHTLKSIFDHIERLKKDVYVAIDEFQQIANYPEKGVEALLRSYIQFSHAGFIFSGSRQHLMAEMFSSPKRPFFQSTEFVNLQPLPETTYYDFSHRFFEKRKGNLSEEVFHEVYQRFSGHTWYVQFVMNRLYETTKRADSIEQSNQVIISVVDTLAPQYEMMMTLLTINQVNLLKAIAKEHKIDKPQSVEFIKKYNLSSPSSVKTALDVLVDKELVYPDPNGYIVYDHFMAIWLRRLL